MNVFMSIVNKMNLFIKVMIAVFLAIMSVLIIFQVIFRAIGMSIPWSEELTRYLMEYVVFWGAAYAFSIKNHMIVNVLIDNIGAKKKIVLNTVIYISLIIILLIIAFQSYKWIRITRNQVSAAMQAPMAFVYFSIPSFCLFSIINCVSCLMKDLGLVRGEYI